LDLTHHENAAVAEGRVKFGEQLILSGAVEIDDDVPAEDQIELGGRRRILKQIGIAEMGELLHCRQYATQRAGVREIALAKSGRSLGERRFAIHGAPRGAEAVVVDVGTDDVHSREMRQLSERLGVLM